MNILKDVCNYNESVYAGACACVRACVCTTKNIENKFIRFLSKHVQIIPLYMR